MPPLPVVDPGVNCDADQCEGNEDPPQGIDIRHQRQDGGLGISQNVLRDFDTGYADGRNARRAIALQGATARLGLRQWVVYPLQPAWLVVQQ